MKFSVGPVLGLLLVAPFAEAAPDPWNVDKDLPATPAAAWVSGQDSCEAVTGQALDLATVVRTALCRNPATRISWLQAYAQAERVGAAKAAYLPTLDATAGQSRSFGDGGGRNTTSAGLSLGWLIYDFGARASSIRSSELTLSALQLSHDDSLQAVLKSAVDAYYQWFTADASLVAAREAESAASETLRAAESRFQAGTGTREDILQAQTAQAQARLTVIQREGDRENAIGALAVVLGAPANTPLTLAAPANASPSAPDAALPDWNAMLERSSTLRPDLRAQQLRIDVAEANRDNTAAGGRPTISLSARDSYSYSDGSDGNSGSVGINLSVPLFSGFRTTYQTRAAEKQVEIERANYEKLKQSSSLELWQAWQGVRTAAATVTAADTVLASAQESLRAARARYQAGLGNLINVLNAQSTLANASQQQSRARYDWYRARITLARASGELGWADLATPAEGNLP